MKDDIKQPLNSISLYQVKKKYPLYKINIIIISIIIFITISLGIKIEYICENTQSSEFTKEEQDYINNNKNKTFVIGVNMFYSQIYYDENHNLSGYLPKVLDIISEQTGLNFKYEFGSWNYLYSSTLNGEIDILVGANETEKRKEILAFTEPLEKQPYWCYSKEDYNSMVNLQDKTVGLIRGDMIFEFIINEYSITFDAEFYDTFEELVQALNNNTVDAIIYPETPYVRKEVSNGNMTRNFQVQDITSDTTLSSSKNNEILINIISKVINNNYQEVEEIFEVELAEFYKNYLNLTEEEKKYLRENKVLDIGITSNYIPYDYIDSKGNYHGISGELIKEICRILEVDYNIIDTGSGFNKEQLNNLLDKNKIDIITSEAKTVYKENHYFFSLPYSKSIIAVVANNHNDKIINNIYDLEGQDIAIPKGYWQEEYLKYNKVDANIILCDDIYEAMELIETNKADYTFEQFLLVSRIIKDFGYENIEVVSELDFSKEYHLMVKDEILQSIINKTMGLINLSSIKDKGLIYTYDIGRDYELYEKLSVVFFLILCAVGIYIIYLINKLNLEKEKAEKANSSKSEFLAKISHEIRTPLTAIMGYIKLLNQSENINGREKEQLKIVYNSSNILLNLVNDILDFSKIEAGKFSLTNEEFNIKLMINNAANIIGIMAEEKRLEFVVNIGGNIPTYIYGDERRLEQVLINIMSNAVKFTHEGKIELNIDALYFDDKVRLDFLISDTGKGMETEKLDIIFEAFQQEDNSISRSYGGTGLGLYISRDFIKRMNGDVKVISSKGKGTKFKFFTIHKMGNNKDIEQIKQADITTIKELEGKKILLVEDNDINQLIIKDILFDMGFKVVIASNGLEAVEIANEEFDVILMDIQMPVMDGISAVKLLKVKEELKNTPIIAFSANVMPEQIREYLKAGFDGYCSKPIIVKELEKTLIDTYKKINRI